MEWSIDTDPFVVHYAKPRRAENEVSYPAASFTLMVKGSCGFISGGVGMTWFF